MSGNNSLFHLNGEPIAQVNSIARAGMPADSVLLGGGLVNPEVALEGVEDRVNEDLLRISTVLGGRRIEGGILKIFVGSFASAA